MQMKFIKLVFKKNGKLKTAALNAAVFSFNPILTFISIQP